MLVLPETPEPLAPAIGRWLRDHLQTRRNTVRFVLPRAGLGNAYLDRELLVLARATLTAGEWAAQNGEYRRLQTRYQSELRDLLKKRFDRFAVLRHWLYTQPEACALYVEPLKKQGAQIPEAIADALLADVFVPEDFEAAALAAAAANDSLGKLLRELQEPRPNAQDCIPWLGETVTKEKLLRLCARGKLALNVRGTEQLQALPGESEEAAWARMRARLPYSGRQLDEVKLMEPTAQPSTGGAAPQPGTVQPQPAGGLFGDLAIPTPPLQAPSVLHTPKPQVSLQSDATSTLNQLHQVRDTWAIPPKAVLSQVQITITATSSEQLQKILKDLPDGLTVSLSLQKDAE